MPQKKQEERLKSALRDNLKKRKKALRDRENKNEALEAINLKNNHDGASESE